MGSEEGEGAEDSEVGTTLVAGVGASGVVAVVASATAVAAVSTTTKTNRMGMVLPQVEWAHSGVRLAEVLDTGLRAAQGEVGIAGISSAKDLVGTMTGKRNGQGIEGISGFFVCSFRFAPKVTVCFGVEYFLVCKVRAIDSSRVSMCGLEIQSSSWIYISPARSSRRH
ncbi:hypothetical protein B0H16DRAFT_1511045 [Mycena metata]|uniref:Uncharacterized protein n=1 Tax=Mycena metata TaxID=1033252 RepID=A0AAD7JYI5_9AGAR|nr:hypothetical protein B0H16DRAFT_1511045 [Mycena metata]